VRDVQSKMFSPYVAFLAHFDAVPRRIVPVCFRERRGPSNFRCSIFGMVLNGFIAGFFLEFMDNLDSAEANRRVNRQ